MTLTWMDIAAVVPGDRMNVGETGAIVTWKSRSGMTAVKPTGFAWADSQIAAFYRTRWELWQRLLMIFPHRKE